MNNFIYIWQAMGLISVPIAPSQIPACTARRRILGHCFARHAS